MLNPTSKRVKLKGKIGLVVREQYLRDDLPCYSPLCHSCLPNTQELKTSQLYKDATHYAIPSLSVVENYLEILESTEIKGLIILQSIADKVSQSIGSRFHKRLLKICKDIRQGNVVFLNEFHKSTHVQREMSDSFETWMNKCCVKTAEFYADHLNGVIPIFLLAENVEDFKALVKHESITVCSFKDYLEAMWKNESLLQQFESLTLALTAGTVKDLSGSYENYLPSDALQAGIKSGQFSKGYLRVNKHNPSEAFVASSRTFIKDSGDIFINGAVDRNRAVHGDEVVVKILPKDQWKCRSSKLVDDAFDSKTETDEETANAPSALPTGRVVGILERGWRNYVATLPEEDEDSSSTTRNRERILVVPFDYRIPKIRIVTKQADSLRNKRIVVRLNNWERDSQYPNGHLVQTIGNIGELETEVQSLLIEHDLLVGEFSKNVISELPLCTEDKPWSMSSEEISKRRDIRNTHFVFSIDPKGCEDVDDALSIRDLPNGSIELGVHIADVTYFVQDSSLVDLEARSRSTSIYLPDRRYDMLPHVLSGNLCSLLGNVDRYAVSVLWELDSVGKVQNVWYGRTIINSKYKLCYEAAQEILLGKPAKDVVTDIPELQDLSSEDLEKRFKELKNAVFKLYDIANVIRGDRLNSGGLELNSIDMKFEIDSNLPSSVADVKSRKELAIHKTVAECMIFANHWVAKKITAAFPHQAVLRRHPNPRESDLADLQKLAESKGFTLNVQSNKELAASLEKVIDAQDPYINQTFRILATQTMNQATYCCTSTLSLAEFYHYGLGLDRYTHFTSPIRRYADILVHRLLLASVGNSETGGKNDSMEVEEICQHMNKKHKAAQDLEKDAQQLFLAFYFEELNSQGKASLCIADAVVYSLKTNGVLVFIPKYGIKGAVCLCNKDKKVALVKEAVEWVEGKLISDESCLSVESHGSIQKYHIFDHITVHVKVNKSRSHQHRIVFDLIDNKPLISDWCESEETPGVRPLPNETKVEKSRRTECKPQKERKHSETEELDLYLFLQNIRAMTLVDNSSR